MPIVSSIKITCDTSKFQTVQYNVVSMIIERHDWINKKYMACTFLIWITTYELFK